MTLDYAEPRSSKLHRAGILPPWLWFWLATYLLLLPGLLVYLWQETIQSLLSPRPFPEGMGGRPLAIMAVLPGITELLPVAMLLAGVVCVLLPHLRKRYVEHRYNLAFPSAMTPVLIEIIEVVEEYAPDVEIKVNLKRGDQIAFTYATGYRKSAIAVFAGLVKLWRKDRESAKAVLLHELGHCRHGDVLMVGAGSFFETLLNAWLPFLLLFFILPSVVAFAWLAIASFQDQWELAQQMSELNRQAKDINAQLRAAGLDPVALPAQKNWFLGWIGLQFHNLFWVELPGSISIIFSLLVFTPIVIASPLMATWCAEFNADQFVVSEQQSPEPLLRGLELVSPKLSRWKWLTSRLSHPPTRLRQWMARYGQSSKPMLMVLLLFPLSYLIKLVFLNVRAIATSFGVFNFKELMQLLPKWNATGLSSLAPLLLGTGVVLLLYPRLAAVWEGVFCKERCTANPPSYKEYAIAAVISGGLGVLAYAIAAIAQ